MLCRLSQPLWGAVIASVWDAIASMWAVTASRWAVAASTWPLKVTFGPMCGKKLNRQRRRKIRPDSAVVQAFQVEEKREKERNKLPD